MLKQIGILLLNFGEAMILLSGLIALWDIRNEFLPWVLGAALLMIGLGMVMQ